MRLGTLYMQAQDLTKNYRDRPVCPITPHAWYQELQVVGFELHHRSKSVVLRVDEVPDKLQGLRAETLMTLAHQNALYFGYTVTMAKPLEAPQPIVAISTYDEPNKRRSMWDFRTDIRTTGYVTIEQGKFTLEVQARLDWRAVEHIAEWAAYSEIPDDVYQEILAVKGAMESAVGWLPEEVTSEPAAN